MFTNAKVLHHLGGKSHNFEQVEQLMWKKQLKFHTKGTDNRG